MKKLINFFNNRKAIRLMVILRGLPGSGKSSIAKMYKDKYHDSCDICATDDYWLRPDGIYDFNIELIGKSHKWNQDRVVECIERHKQKFNNFDHIIVIDNTNITRNEMRPYIKLARKYNYDVTIREPNTEWRFDVEECFIRNTHGVPYATILRMYHNWEPTLEVDKEE